MSPRIPALVLCAMVGLAAAEPATAPPGANPPGQQPSATPAPQPQAGPARPSPNDPTVPPPAAAAFREGPVRAGAGVHTLNTIDPVNGRDAGPLWIYGALADRVPAAASGASGVVQEPVYVAFSSEETLQTFAHADADMRRRYIAAARANRAATAAPTVEGQPRLP